MKQKNSVLVAVAVGFGLLAALLAMQMNNQPEQQAVTDVNLPTAKGDIPLDTLLTKEKLPEYVQWKAYKREQVPPGAWATTEDELVDKRVNRTYHDGELFNLQDLNTRPRIEIPDGYHLYSIPINRTALAGGWAAPGSKVDLLATVRSAKLKKTLTFPFLQDMLVVAVDINSKLPPEQRAVAAVTDVSFAVTKEQARLIKAAQDRGAGFSILLIGSNKAPDGSSEASVQKYDFEPTRDQVWKILMDEYTEGGTDSTPEDQSNEAKTVVMVELPVPKENLPAGTELTTELIDSKFTTLKIEPPAPENVVQNIRSHQGKVLVKEINAYQFVPIAFVADYMPKAEEAPKQVAEARPDAPPPVYHDVKITTPSGTKKVRYQKLNNKWLYIGELKLEDDPDDPANRPKSEPTSPPTAKPEVRKANPTPNRAG